MKLWIGATVRGAVAAAAAGALAMAGFALAQSSWVTVSEDDLQICRPIFSEVHRLEQKFIGDEIAAVCAEGGPRFDAASCQETRDWLAETQELDPVAWYFAGNDSCEGADYPCFGPSLANQPRTGRDAQLWITKVKADAARPAQITPEMGFADATVEGDRCISQVWLKAYNAAGGGAPGTASAGAGRGPRAAARMNAAPAAAGPVAAATSVPAAEIDACVDGTAPVATCSALLPRLKGDEAAYTDVAIALMQVELDAGRPAAAIGYGDMIAALRTGQEADLIRCNARALAKWDLTNGLAACTAAGGDNPAALELRGQIYLLGGKWQDAWNDFDAAFRAGGAMQPLFLRGLASAALGKTGDGLKDMAQAEQGAPGTTDAFDDTGYSLAAVMAGKPLAPPEAFAGLDAPPPAAAPAPTATPPQAQAAATPPPAARSPITPFNPAAPRGKPTPLGTAEVIACNDDLKALRQDADTWKLTADEKNLRLGTVQRTIFVGRCAGHPQSAELIAEAEKVIADFAPRAASVRTTIDQTTQAELDCVEPMLPTDKRNPTGTTAFHNGCGYPVYVAYCNVSPASGSWAEAFTCGTKNAFAIDLVPASGALAAVFGTEVSHFACRKPALPLVSYSQGAGLEGYCK